MNQLSYWERNSFFENVDIAIIGSGIVGLSTAIALHKKHKKLKILVLEKDFITMGASTRNAGFACFGSAGELLDDLEKHSEDSVFSLVEKRWLGLKLLRKNLGDKTIDFQNLGGYEIFEHKNEFEKCAERLDFLNKNIAPITGTKVVFKNATTEIKNFGLRGVSRMLVNTCEGQIDSGKMMSALLTKAQASGILVINSFEVQAFEDNKTRVNVVSKNGISFTTRRLVICNNGFANTLLPEMPVIPARAQVLITKPVKNLRLKGTFHFDKGYYYFRNMGDRILLGGGRNLDFLAEQTAINGLTDIVQNRLEEILIQIILPKTKFEIDMRWSGIMGVGPDKTAIIKSVSDNVYCAIRMGGMGIAIGSLVGEEAAQLVSDNL